MTHLMACLINRVISYFLVQEDNDGCDYVIVIQMESAEADIADDIEEHLSSVRGNSNVKILKHVNECFDIGTVGWVYSSMDVSRYSFFIWINSSVRGPFMPSYIDNKYHWTRAFTGKITDKVKLVGSTLCCGEIEDYPPTLHVQTYAVATDSVGLDILRKNETVFGCYKELRDVVLYSERGMSETMLNAGYGLDSLMARYQGIDWVSMRSMADEYGCNGDLNPIQPGFYDGTDIDPMEVMFVKVKGSFLEAGWASATRAERLSTWKYEATSGNATEHILVASQNNWLDVKMDRLVEDAKRRGMSCFDWEFYLNANKQDPLIDDDVDDDDVPGEAWDQFIEMGIFEGRPYRWRNECIS